jgi:hypothetical protein
MYTHARQFPHLAGMTDSDVRELVRRAMRRRPRSIRALRVRNAIIYAGMVAAAGFLAPRAGMGVGAALIVVGTAGTLAIIAWNLFWVNTVLFRVTKEEKELGASAQG